MPFAITCYYGYAPLRSGWCLGKPVEGIDAVGAKKPEKLPVVLSRSEAETLTGEVPEGLPRCLIPRIPVMAL